MMTRRTTTLLAHLHSRTLALGLAGLAGLAGPVALAAGAVATTALVAGCDDENDPKTWVKRLDDPAQRAAAIKRLTQFFEDDDDEGEQEPRRPGGEGAPRRHRRPDDQARTSACTLDEKTRKDLMKFLADTRDPRTAPALAKAFNEYEPGRTTRT